MGKLLQEAFGLVFIDIDEIRNLIFNHRLNLAKSDLAQDEKQMLISYNFLFFITELIIKSNQAVIVAATFSREVYHTSVINLAKDNYVPIRAVYCFAPDAVIKKRALERRNKESSYSTVRDFSDYERVRSRYKLGPWDNAFRVDTSLVSGYDLEKIIDFCSS